MEFYKVLYCRGYIPIVMYKKKLFNSTLNFEQYSGQIDKN